MTKHHNKNENERDKRKSSKHSEKRFKRKLGKKLIKSVNGGISKVKKKFDICKANGVSIDYADRKTSAATLHVASILGLKDVVTYLIENGAMVDIRDIYGNTPLLYAVTHHHPDVAKVLVTNGASLHSINQKGQSPLSLGVSNLLQLSSGNVIDLDDDEKDEKNEKNDNNENNENNEGEDDEEDEEIVRVRKEWEREERRKERERERERERWGGDDDDFDWRSHLEEEYNDEEGRNHYEWREIEEEYKEMEDDSWMDRIAAQAREKYSRVHAQKIEEKKQNEQQQEKEESYRRLLEEEMQKDKEWRERVRRAAEMNHSEKDEEKWVDFEDMNLKKITFKDIPWPSGPLDNILGIKDTLLKPAKKQLVRAGLLRWHPDKFMQKFGSRLLDEEREKILERVKEVSQCINQYSEKRLA